jgi:hypothetical protein
VLSSICSSAVFVDAVVPFLRCASKLFRIHTTKLKSSHLLEAARNSLARSVARFKPCSKEAMHFCLGNVGLAQLMSRLTAAGVFFLATLSFAGEKSADRHDCRYGARQLTYVLPAGTTSLIVRLIASARGRNVTVINRNSAADGELSIAVSDRLLVAESSEWRPVVGTIPFRSKRLFRVSLVGVEAKFVRLRFRVAASSRDTENAPSSSKTARAAL